MLEMLQREENEKEMKERFVIKTRRAREEDYKAQELEEKKQLKGKKGAANKGQSQSKATQPIVSKTQKSKS